MPVSFVKYDLVDGYVHHWLTSGPQPLSIGEHPIASDGDAYAEMAANFYEPESGITKQPVEPGPLVESELRVGDYRGTWSTFRCRDDHFVDLTAGMPTCHYLRGWAYTQLVAEDAGSVLITLEVTGPVDVWMGNVHVFGRREFGRDRVSFTAALNKGVTEVVARFEQVAAVQGAPTWMHALALRIYDTVTAAPVPGLVVRLPTLIGDLSSRKVLETAFEKATLDRDVYTADESITVTWDDDLGNTFDAAIRLQTPSGRIYAESSPSVSPGLSVPMRGAFDVPAGALRIRLMSPLQLYYDENLRVNRVLYLWGMGRQRYSSTPYGTIAERQREALRYASGVEGELYSEIAKMALGAWETIAPKVVLDAIASVGKRSTDSLTSLVGLLGMAIRWQGEVAFSEAIGAPLETCVLSFDYAPDARTWDAVDTMTESGRLLLYTAELLAGQLFADRTFAASVQTGKWHRERAEQQVLAWLRARGARGFGEWDSPATFAGEFVALTHLIDLVESEAVWELASVVMDKLLYTIAANSYQAVLGGTQGRATLSSILGGGLLSPLSGVTRVLWGVGVFNLHLPGIVSVACMEDYELPPLMPAIAVNQPDEAWSRERHAVSAGQDVNKVAYRTPNYLLASAQDYRPFEPGSREHIWQATLGPEAVVFTTHPASMGMTDAHAPGFWLGSASLPRVAQWKDALVAIYDLPSDATFQFTHAYFPVYAFDATALRQSAQGRTWAFARKGDGYVALTASVGFEFVTQGPGAHRELRACEPRAVWLCQMGQASQDGDFEAFQAHVLALPVTFDGLSVQWTTLRGEKLTFGQQGPFLRDGESQLLSGYKHYESPYSVTEMDAAQMEIVSGAALMRLHFEEVSELS